MTQLTDRQAYVLEFVTNWLRKYGYPPSINEVASGLGVKPAAAAEHLQILERKGALSRDARRRRSLTLAHQIPSLFQGGLRLVCDIAAGAPLAVEEMAADETLDLSPAWFGRGEHVALRVRGDSMTGDAIADGDFAIVRLQKSATSSEIAALRIRQGETTLKRLFIVGPEAHLKSSNPDHLLRVLPAAEVEVVGVLAGVLRRTGGAWQAR